VTPRGRRWWLIDCEYGAHIGAGDPLLIPSNPTLADKCADGTGKATELRDIRSLGLMIQGSAQHLSQAVVDLASDLCSDSGDWERKRRQAFGKLVAIAGERCCACFVDDVQNLLSKQCLAARLPCGPVAIIILYVNRIGTAVQASQEGWQCSVSK
jgi:hypothetical protein